MRSVLSAYRGPIGRALPVSWLYVWGPALLAVAVIAVESTRTFSSENTSGWLRPLFEAVLGGLSDPAWTQAHHLIRKTGHFIGYGAVCVSFLRAWLWQDLARAQITVAGWRERASFFGVVCTVAIAALDEWHQTFLPNRTGKVADVMLDTCGGIVACGVLWMIFWRRDCRADPTL